MKNPTEELTTHILFTLVVGYFANAQYDELFFHVILNGSEESHRRTDGYIFLALVVGYFADAQYDVHFYLSLRGSVATKQTPGRVEVYGAYSPYFFRRIAAALRVSQ